MRLEFQMQIISSHNIELSAPSEGISSESIKNTNEVGVVLYSQSTSFLQGGSVLLCSAAGGDEQAGTNFNVLLKGYGISVQPDCVTERTPRDPGRHNVVVYIHKINHEEI